MSEKVLNKLRTLILCLGSFWVLLVLQGLVMFFYNCVCIVLWGMNVLNDPVIKAGRHIVYAVVVSVLMGGFYAGYIKRSYAVCSAVSRPAADKIYGLSGIIRRILLLLILGIAMQTFVYGIINLVYMLMPDNSAVQSYKDVVKNINGSSTYIIYFYTMLFGPIVEEIAFRGVIFGFALRSYGVAGSIIIQAVCFGLFHGNIIQGLYAFALGCIMCYVRYATDSLVQSVYLHAVVNISGILVAPVIAVILLYYANMGRMSVYAILTVAGGILLILCCSRMRLLVKGVNYETD